MKMQLQFAKIEADNHLSDFNFIDVQFIKKGTNVEKAMKLTFQFHCI